MDAEDAEILYLLDCAQYGYLADQKERMQEQEEELERIRAENG